ncbi:MAG: alanine racemase [Nitrospira sp.]|nr:alanine racemase [Nitrospira sp.]
MRRGAVAEINLSAIAHNLETVKKIIQNRPIISVVKADAYGHGSVEVSKKLIKEGTSYLAVAFSSEAIQLRDAGITAPIIVLFDSEDITSFFDFNLIPVIHNMNTASAISRVARERRTSIKVHVKIDTGMGRLGLSGTSLPEDLVKISKMDGIEVGGLMSHFSDADLSDRSYALFQLERFHTIKAGIFKSIKGTILTHIANSAAILTFEAAYLDAVRPGLMLYGYSPLQHPALSTQHSALISLMPAMKVKTIILTIRNLPPNSPISYGRTFITRRQSKIGILPVGYADGYSRLLSNSAEVLVKGRRVPVVGRICMDLTMIDLTDIEDVSECDEVVILGEQGNDAITAYELADKAKTIPYEILTSLGSHSRKQYINVQTD